MKRCRWCFKDLAHCPEGGGADKTWLPRPLLKLFRKSLTAQHLESFWVQMIRDWHDYRRNATGGRR